MIRTDSKRFVNNASWIIVGQLVQLVISFFVSTITARYLGPENYGILNYISSFITFFVPITSLGLTNLIIKELVENHTKNGEVLGTCIGLRLLSSTLSIIIVYFIVYFLNDHDPLLLTICTLQSFTLFFSSFDIFEQWFQSKMESKYSSSMRMISYTIVSIYKVFILVNEKTIEWFAFSNSLDTMVLAILLYILYKRNGGSKLRFSLSYGVKILKNSYNFVLSGLMVVLYGQIDKVMLSIMSNNTIVGYYSTAVYLCQLWTFLLNAIITSASPMVYGYKNINETKYKNTLMSLYGFVFWAGVFVSMVFFVFGKYIIIILYGREYLPALEALKVITWYTSFAYLGVVRSMWLIAENKVKYEKYFTAIGALTNVILNLLLIPDFGMVGAAVASLVTQIISCLIAPSLFDDTRESVKHVIIGMNPKRLIGFVRENLSNGLE